MFLCEFFVVGGYSDGTLVIHFVCVCVLVTTSSVKNLSKCIPFDQNGGVLFWALDLEIKD